MVGEALVNVPICKKAVGRKYVYLISFVQYMSAVSCEFNVNESTIYRWSSASAVDSTNCILKIFEKNCLCTEHEQTFSCYSLDITV